MSEDYDIVQAIKRIEDELIASMIANLDRHRAEEDELGINWGQWQVKQFAALEEYKRKNQERYGGIFNNINSRIDALITVQRTAGNSDQEVAILQAIKKGAALQKAAGRQAAINAQFFRMNDRRMNALIRATKNDLKKAEYAMLRMTNDKYRKIIFDAQMYAASGSATYEKAVDMAAKDFLQAGINCVEYKNGARHTVSDYADMAVRTAGKRAYLAGEGEKRKEWGISTVIMNKRGNPCPKCLPFCGKVLIDDVWSGGSSKDGPYPLMSSAIAAGLYHPRCRDIHTTYFPEISGPPDDKYTQIELSEIEENAKTEAERQYAERQMEKFGRLARYSLDSVNREKYGKKEDEWKTHVEQLIEPHSPGYIEVTEDWLKHATPDSHEIADLLEITIAGTPYTVNGKEVVLDYSKKEKEIAEILKQKLGGEIHMVPKVYVPQGISTPDYLFRGKKFDLKEISGSSKNVLYNAISKKRKQADNFVIDISECPLAESEIYRQVGEIYWSKHTDFVDELIVIKNNAILRIFKRVKK